MSPDGQNKYLDNISSKVDDINIEKSTRNASAVEDGGDVIAEGSSGLARIMGAGGRRQEMYFSHEVRYPSSRRLGIGTGSLVEVSQGDVS